MINTEATLIKPKQSYVFDRKLTYEEIRAFYETEHVLFEEVTLEKLLTSYEND